MLYIIANGCEYTCCVCEWLIITIFILKQSHDLFVLLSCECGLHWWVPSLIQHFRQQASCFWASHSFHAICGPSETLFCSNTNPLGGIPDHNACTIVVCDWMKNSVRLVSVWYASHEKLVDFIDGLPPPSASHIGEWGHGLSVCPEKDSSSKLNHEQ